MTNNMELTHLSVGITSSVITVKERERKKLDS